MEKNTFDIINNINKKERAFAVIDLDKAKENFNKLKKMSNSYLCPVIKANAYGHGSVVLGKLYEDLGADYIAVASLGEALELRRNGLNIPILILGYTDPIFANTISQNNLTQTLYSYQYGLELLKYCIDHDLKIKVHLKIDTGMGRIGFVYRSETDNELNFALELLNNNYFICDGIFTHFSNVGTKNNQKEFTNLQFQRFSEAVDFFKSKEISFNYIHYASSAAIMEYKNNRFNMIRPGILLYGINPFSNKKTPFHFKPILTFVSKLICIKDLKKGDSVGYNQKCILKKNAKVGTVPVGYADGFSRQNSCKNNYVIINGTRCKILGNICMDQFMVDISHLSCKLGDNVLIYADIDGQRICDFSKRNKLSPYEIATSIGRRIPRYYLKSGKIYKKEKYL